MKVQGSIYVVHDATTNTLEVIAENQGASPGIFTQCVVPDRETAVSGNSFTQADDRRYGHGEEVPDGAPDKPGIAVTRIPIGSTYVSDAFQGKIETKVAPGAWIRVGFRQRAWKAVEIPRAGEAVRIPFEEMEAGTSTGRFKGWRPQRSTSTAGDASPAILRSAHALLQRQAHHVVGEIQIHPVAREDGSGQLAGWEVWALNTATSTPKGLTNGFIATIVLLDANGKSSKNAGLGLESMPCPGPGYRIAQLITADGDYGTSLDIRARPGTRARLGVRGYSTYETTLPSLEEGVRAVSLSSFQPTASSSQSSWFETGPLLRKCSEKKNELAIFFGERQINAEIPDCEYIGAEAFLRAELKDPPRVQIDWAERDEIHGWRIRVQNRLPDRDAIGPLAFPMKLRITGETPRELAPYLFTPAAREAEWFVPSSTDEGRQIFCGDHLIVDTGPLGWRGTLPLPELDESFDSDQSQERREEVWVLRETDFKRALLHPPE